MNPNSANQVWSRWTWKVRPAPGVRPSLETVKANFARFARKAFGSVGQARIVEGSRRRPWTVDLRVEGAAIQDAGYVEYMRANFDLFLRNGFGGQAAIAFSSRLEAGSPQTGRPSDQLIIAPSIVIEEFQS